MMSMIRRHFLWLFIPALIFSGGASAQMQAGRLIDYRLEQRYTPDGIKKWFKAQHIPQAVLGTRYGLDVFVVHYYTTHADGRTVMASGMLYVPRGDLKPSPMLVYDHGSYACRDIYFNGRDEQVICLAFATDGYVVLCPDYIGMGEGEGNQMLLNAPTEAGCTVDLMLAVSGLWPELKVQLSKDLFLSGYSQGGHASMATCRLLQDKYKDRFPVTAASPMSGPYDVEGTVYDARMIPNENPVYLMMLFASYYESIDSFSSLGRALVHPYDSFVPALMNGQWPEEVINDMLPDSCYKTIKPDLFKDFSDNPESPMRRYLRSNNVYDWKPESPTQLCYCMHDEQVPYRNSFTAYNAMKKNGSDKVFLWLVGKKFRHINCATFAIVYTKMFFDGFLKGKPMSHGPAGKRMLLNIGKLFVKP